MRKVRFYPESTLEKLEFPKILSEVKAYAKSPQGKLFFEEYEISTDVEEVKKWLEETNEYKRLIQMQTPLPIDYLIDLEVVIRLLGIDNAVLDPEQLIAIRKVTLVANSVFKFFEQDEENLIPRLKALAGDAYFDKNIVKLIDAVIDENKEVKDNASKELQEIRLSLSKKRQELDRVFARLASKYQKLGLLSDIEQSFRNGRRVLGIVAESKRQIQGIIHDESDTGKTVFLEPAETASLNNAIFDLERAEEREVYRILRELTAHLSVYKNLIAQYHFMLANLDAIQAKAQFALLMGANYPIINKSPIIKLHNAFHPLLYLHNKALKKTTVPLDLTLNLEKHILVISGPNAGGKTICLKTVALLQMMLQYGLLIPVDERSEFSVFHQLFLDIGDSQSIEYELSTYSSHLKSMKYFVEFCDEKTLFLIDELGSGTDPALGGAFAEVILENLASKKAFGVVTTHYLNLKIMAGKVAGIINGAMSFDEQNLLPLYKLMVGKPGSSHTFSIAERSGIPKPLIDRAKTLVDIEHLRYDHMLSSIEILEKQLDEKSTEVKGLKSKIEELLTVVNEEKKQTAALKNRIQQSHQTHHKPSPFYREAEKIMQRLLREWEAKKEKFDEQEKIAIETRKLFEKMYPIKAEVSKKKVNNAKQKETVFDEQEEFMDGEIMQGSLVKVVHLNQRGKVISISGKRAKVDMGGIPMEVEVKNLRLIS